MSRRKIILECVPICTKHGNKLVWRGEQGFRCPHCVLPTVTTTRQQSQINRYYLDEEVY